MTNRNAQGTTDRADGQTAKRAQNVPSGALSRPLGNMPGKYRTNGYVCAPTLTVGCDSAESTEVTAAGPPSPAGSLVSTCDCGRGLGGYAAIRSFISLGNCVVKRPSPQPRPGSLAIAWLSTPTISVETRSMASSESASGPSCPAATASAIAARGRATSSALGAHASAEGSKFGTGRQILSCAIARWAS